MELEAKRTYISFTNLKPTVDDAMQSTPTPFLLCASVPHHISLSYLIELIQAQRAKEHRRQSSC